MSCFAWQRAPLEVYFNPDSKTGKSAHISLWLSNTEKKDPRHKYADVKAIKGIKVTCAYLK
jgi:hypothetical protein